MDSMIHMYIHPQTSQPDPGQRIALPELGRQAGRHHTEVRQGRCYQVKHVTWLDVRRTKHFSPHFGQYLFTLGLRHFFFFSFFVFLFLQTHSIYPLPITCNVPSNPIIYRPYLNYLSLEVSAKSDNRSVNPSHSSSLQYL